MKKVFLLVFVVVGMAVLSSCHKDRCPAYKIELGK
jgi:hypothetical protein